MLELSVANMTQPDPPCWLHHNYSATAVSDLNRWPTVGYPYFFNNFFKKIAIKYKKTVCKSQLNPMKNMRVFKILSKKHY